MSQHKQTTEGKKKLDKTVLSSYFTFIHSAISHVTSEHSHFLKLDLSLKKSDKLISLRVHNCANVTEPEERGLSSCPVTITGLKVSRGSQHYLNIFPRNESINQR